MIEFFFDCSSPWTYLAFHNIQPLIRDLQIDIRWRPILVGGIFNTVNHAVYESRSNPVPAKQHYMVKDLRDWAARSGLQIIFPPEVFPVNSVKAMRGCIHLDGQGKLVLFAKNIFEMYWGENLDISQHVVLREACLRSGVDPDDFFAGIAQSQIKDALRQNTEELIARGGFGSPTMFVNRSDMYFGNDRLELVREAILHRQPNVPA